MSNNRIPNWLNNAIFYQIYPQSFYDSNSDGIGDIPGIIQKLDYIEWLGVNALWLNPCFVSPFQDAGYDVADYYNVAPRYGTNQDLKRLCEQAHRRNIKVCLDLVPGHTSIEHPWFKASCRHERNEYADRYIWTNSTWDPVDNHMKFIIGYAERDGAYATNFLYCQPALNYGYAKPDPRYPWQQPVDAPGQQAMRKELRKIMAYWLDMGADGFRVDMAESLIKNDPEKKEIRKLWREIREWMNKAYPEAVLIAEWGNPSQAIAAGFHIDFMFHFNVPGYRSLFFNEKGFLKGDKCFFGARGEGTATDFLGEYLKQYMNCDGGYISIPSANHDFQRPSVGRTVDELKVIFTFLLTWPGVPFVYYGDEIGMRYIEGLPSKEGGYARTGSRTPMQWDDSPNAGFSTASSDKFYLPIDPDPNRPNVKVQEKNSTSLLNHVRQLIALRKNSPGLQANGKLEILYAKPSQYPLVYLRENSNEKYLVAINPADRLVTANFNVDSFNNSHKVIGHDVEVILEKNKMSLTMDGISFAVLKIYNC
jgi:maltose alpha-D-glucosyltransferase/alpha-amylase